MTNVWKIIPIIFAAIVLTISARAQSLPDLPKFPISPLSKADYDGLAKSDNPEGWKALAERSKKTAVEYFKKQLYDDYTHTYIDHLLLQSYFEAQEQLCL